MRGINMTFGITELNVRYSDVITDYLNKGYVISPFTIGDGFSSGKTVSFKPFSSVKTFLDLVNPKEKNVIYRAWLKTAYSKDLELLKIEVRKYNRKVFCGTLRPDEGDIVNEKSFFVVSEKGVYTDSEDEITRINKCRSDRRALQESLERLSLKNDRHLEVDKLPADFIDNIMVRINRVRGFKHANATCIKTVTLYKESRYDWINRKQVNKLEARVFFSYNGKTATIYLG